MDTLIDSKPSPKQPQPDDFVAFLPWACNELEIDSDIIVQKEIQQDYVSAADRSKAKAKSKIAVASNVDDTVDKDWDEKKSSHTNQEPYEDVTIITAVYENNGNLVQIKFTKNIRIPRIIFKILGMIVVYHPYLQTIIIDSGIDKYTLYEIGKFLPFSTITDICLDGAFFQEANYDLLLENLSNLRHLSLARCKINDEVVQTIATQLVYPLPASRRLYLLNLSANRITDIGAKYLSKVLRSNRQLLYLNLSGNMITDDGGIEILNVLLKFPLTFEEGIAFKTRHIAYLQKKNELVAKQITKLKEGDFDRKLNVRKSKSMPTSLRNRKTFENDASSKCISDTGVISNSIFLDKAETLAIHSLGEFKDPFDNSETIVENGILYCLGNNALSYLNLSYNNLSFIFLKKLLLVVKYQRYRTTVTRGLINFYIEGNNMPFCCSELSELQNMLETGVMTIGSRTVSKKGKVLRLGT